MLQRIFLVCGVPGSGKSWVCRQLKQEFEYIAHDRCWTHPTLTPSNDEDPQWPSGAKSTHIACIYNAAKAALKPILTECPFNERKLKEELIDRDLKVTPIFVVEHPDVVRRRYESREKKPCPQNVLTRALSIQDRAVEWNAFWGTSAEVLKHLKDLSHA